MGKQEPHKVLYCATAVQNVIYEYYDEGILVCFSLTHSQFLNCLKLYSKRSFYTLSIIIII